MTFRYCTEFDAKTNKQRPAPHSVGQTLRRNFHWKCLLSTLLIHACALYAIWCHISRHGTGAFATLSAKLSNAMGVARACSHGYAFIPGAFGALLYAVYLAECWHYRRRLTAVPTRSSAQIYALARRMREAIPIVWWKSVCYHYLRRTRQVTRYRNGDAITATQVYYERVNSHSSGNVFHYDACGYKDISKELADLESYPLIRMRFTKGFVFACVQAADEFEEQRTRFFNENEVRDDYMEVREGLDLANVPFTEQVLVYAAPATGLENEASDADSDAQPSEWKAPWYMRPTAYWIASALLLSWPLRMLVECRTAHLIFQVTKLFGTNYLSPSSANYTGPLTRSSTMESSELELANRNNYIIIPSYSEAILLDPLSMNNNNSSCDGVVERLTSLRNGYCNNNSRARDEQRLASNECLIFANYGTVGSECADLGGVPSGGVPRLCAGYEPLDGANCASQCHAHCCSAYHAPCRSSYCGAAAWRRDSERGGGDANASPYRQTLQRLLAGVRHGADAARQCATDFSPYRRFDESRTAALRRFSLASLAPRQLRSRSMTIFSEALATGGGDASKAPAVRIPRPTQLRQQRRGAKLSRAPSAGSEKLRKLPPRSITFAEGMRIPTIDSARSSYEFSTRIRPAAAASAATTVRSVDAPATHYCEACDSVVVERGTRRIVAAGSGSPFRRAAGAFAVVGVNEPPPPYEMALRMCAPLYERLRRSTASISSLLNTFSASTNNNNRPADNNNNNNDNNNAQP